VRPNVTGGDTDTWAEKQRRARKTCASAVVCWIVDKTKKVKGRKMGRGRIFFPGSVVALEEGSRVGPTAKHGQTMDSPRCGCVRHGDAQVQGSERRPKETNAKNNVSDLRARDAPGPWEGGGPPEADEGLGRGVLAGGACRRLERTVAGPEIDFFVCDDGRRMRRRGLLGRDGCRDAMRACLAAVMLRW